jgi:phosphomannomutase
MTLYLQYPADSLGAALNYTPKALNFGTSGRRGEVLDLTQLEIYLNARAELDYLLALPPAQGGIQGGQAFYLAHDLRASSTHFVPSQGGRGELAQAIELAIRDAALAPINLGEIPTPALTAFAISKGCGSMMITGSHIPFERNGYKTNSAHGELLKEDEAPINLYVARWRERLLAEPFTHSRFAADGNFKHGSRKLVTPIRDGYDAYLRRYREFFGATCLQGLRVLVYQHSAVGRDLLVEMLRQVGAEAIPVGRSETFVPIDTEAIDDTTLALIQRLAHAASQNGQRFDALVSTDGDSDRPLLIGLDYHGATPPQAQFFGGDLVGMIVAEALGADAAVVPISCNDAIDRGALADVLEPKTRIGSPYVIAGMNQARRSGRQRICGWEANGGFLTGSDIEREGQNLTALPTRDAFLPILCVLARMASLRVPMKAIFADLPRRFSRAGLLRNFPRAASQKILAALVSSANDASPVEAFFTPQAGFGSLTKLDQTDGVRLYFSNGDVAHVRPSGNADELRIYAVADTQARADEIVSLGIAEPAGVLRRLAQAFAA